MRWSTRSAPAACCGTGSRSASKVSAWSPPPGASAPTSPGISRLWKLKAPPIRTCPYGRSRTASGWHSVWWTCRDSRQPRWEQAGSRQKEGRPQKPHVIQPERWRIGPQHLHDPIPVGGHDVRRRIKGEREVLRGHRHLRMRAVIRREPRDDVHSILIVVQHDRQQPVFHEQRSCRDIAAIIPPPFRHIKDDPLLRARLPDGCGQYRHQLRQRGLVEERNGLDGSREEPLQPVRRELDSDSSQDSRQVLVGEPHRMVIGRLGVRNRLHHDLVLHWRDAGAVIECTGRQRNEQHPTQTQQGGLSVHEPSFTVTVISIRSKGLSLPSFLAFRIASTVSMPRTTSPNTVYCQSRLPQSSAQMKNWEPALLGSLPRAMDSVPRRWGRLLNSAGIV